MSLLYIVDGCNAAHYWDRLTDRASPDTRVVFLSHLHSHRPQGSFRNRLIVVFDGFPFSGDMFGCEVIFSQDKTADDKIKAMVAELQRPKDAVVVTDDRDLGFSVRANGAAWMRVSDFLNKGKNRFVPQKHRGSDRADQSDLNVCEREAITEELKKLWLKKKSS